MRRWASVVALAALLVGCSASAAEQTGDDGGRTGLVAEGEQLYNATCAACHGVDLRGSDSGPPLLDPVYAPDHHPDGAFHVAAEFGVQQHHWDFGPMPPQNVSEEQVRAIIAYVRSVQRREGIVP